MKNAIKLFFQHCAFYCVVMFTALMLFAVSFRTPLFAYMTIYYYRALLLLGAVSVFICILLIILKRHIHWITLDFKDIIICTVTFASIVAVFVSTAAVSMDRSISVFILADMAQNPDVVFSEQDVQNRFLDVYVDEYGAMQQRFEEQIISGNVVEVDGGYQITQSGENLLKLFRALAVVFPVDGKCLYPPPLEFANDPYVGLE